jgi:hypothetical protein
MPGPPAKDASTRARRNRSSTATTLARPVRPRQVDLPDRPDGQSWQVNTVAWWAELWASPMAPEYDESDVHGLLMLAELVDLFWRGPDRGLAAEIRLHRREFGLSPMSRRSLQWKIERAADGTPAPAARARGRSSGRGKDPRAHLSAV